jgi:uncharacterized protein with FMN-binding domain
MKRAALVGAGTLAGVAALLALNPESARTVASAATTTSGTGDGSNAATPSASTSSNGSSSGASGTYTGAAVDVGRGYGTVQVQVSVAHGKIADVTALAAPQNDPRSSQISSYAVPTLVQQALAAQSSSISGVSGATFTSNGFAQSLASALSQAGLS